MNRILAFLPFLLFAVLAAGLFLALGKPGLGGGKFAQHIGEPAPTTALPLLGEDKGQFTAANWQGNAYMVNFFASWCAPCRAENPLLVQLTQKGIPIIGIAFKDRSQAVRDLLGKQGNPFQMVADDADGRAGIDWGLTGVPETFLIDREGIIRFHFAGPLTNEIIAGQLLPIWEKIKG